MKYPNKIHSKPRPVPLKYIMTCAGCYYDQENLLRGDKFTEEICAASFDEASAILLDMIAEDHEDLYKPYIMVNVTSYVEIKFPADKRKSYNGNF